MKPTPDAAEIVTQLRCASRVRDENYIPLHLSPADCKLAADEIERLRAALGWALGEAPDADGKWFGEVVPDGERLPPYWWRKPLRKLAGVATFTYDKTSRSLVHDAEQHGQTEGK